MTRNKVLVICENNKVKPRRFMQCIRKITGFMHCTIADVSAERVSPENRAKPGCELDHFILQQRMHGGWFERLFHFTDQGTENSLLPQLKTIQVFERAVVVYRFQ